jgi:hypothetical protein
MEYRMSTLELKELSHPSGEVIKIAAGKTLDLNSQGTLVLPTVPHAKMPSGSVLQVISTHYSTQLYSTSGTHTDTGLTATITPSSTSSKILILVNQNGVFKHNGHVSTAINLKLLKGSTNLKTFGVESAVSYLSDQQEIGTVSFNFLDSPSTTSATTYKTTYASTVNGQGVNVQRGGCSSSITLMEIQG